MAGVQVRKSQDELRAMANKIIDLLLASDYSDVESFVVLEGLASAVANAKAQRVATELASKLITEANRLL